MVSESQNSMEASISDRAWTLETVPLVELQASMAEMVEEGLSAPKKYLKPILLYDASGSHLFEEICALEQYYVTRTERAILDANADEIVERAAPLTMVAELGSGSSEKSELILSAALARSKKLHYIPVDISESALVGAAERLGKTFESLTLHAVVADYFQGLKRIKDSLHANGTLYVFLGGNLGNFTPEEASKFLAAVRDAAGPDDHFLIGLDLVKDQRVLEEAYDDRDKVTAAFNLNLLRRINDELDANFNLSAFHHEARWNSELSRIEMHLVSDSQQVVRVGSINKSFSFEEGESIHTESSHKYTPDRIDAMAHKNGWVASQRWTDERDYYSLNLWTPRTD